MKVTITALKAPWPEGAKLGDTYTFKGGEVPPWAVGKCKPLEHGSRPHVEPTVDDGAQQAARAAVEDQKAKHAAEVQSLRADIEAGGAELQAALGKIQQLEARLADGDEARAAASIAAAEEQAAAEKAALAAKPSKKG